MDQDPQTAIELLAKAGDEQITTHQLAKALLALPEKPIAAGDRRNEVWANIEDGIDVGIGYY